MKKIFLTIILFTTALTAQQKIYTLDESIRLGIENSKDIRIARSKMAAAEAKVSEASSQLLPQLKVQGSYQRLSDIPPFMIKLPFLPQPVQLAPVILNSYNLRASLQQPLFTGFRLTSIKNAAGNNYNASMADYEKEINETALKIHNAFWNFYKAAQAKQLLEENVKLVEKHLEDTKQFLENGLATQNDVLKLQVQASNTKLQLLDASNNLDLARSAFNLALGLPLEDNSDITAMGADTSVTQFNFNELLNKANENRNELRSLAYRVRAAENQVTAANSGWFPALFLTADYIYANPNSRIFPPEEKFRDSWDAGITLQWDLWNWGYTSSQTAQAEEQNVQAKSLLAQMQDAVQLEVYQALLVYNKSVEKINLSRLTVRQAEENYRVTNENYNQQLATSTDIIDAEVSLLQAKTNLSASAADYQTAKAKLLKAAGEKIYR